MSLLWKIRVHVFYVPCCLLMTGINILNWEIHLPTFNSWTLVSLFSQSHLTVSVVLYLSLMQGLARSMLCHKEADSATSRQSLQTRHILKETHHLYHIWYYINDYYAQTFQIMFQNCQLHLLKNEQNGIQRERSKMEMTKNRGKTGHNEERGQMSKYERMYIHTGHCT